MSNQASRRIPGLDGIRALAILGVLVGHVLRVPGVPAMPWLAWTEPAFLGVRVFFVVSGFLITSLLLAEIKKTGTVSLGAFYFRRTLRIFPAFYFYIGAIFVCSVLGLLVVEPYDFLSALTYTVNYHRHRGWFLGHAWSLSVEEQFYLLWPFTLKRLGVQRGMAVAAAIIVLSPLIRVGTSVLFPAARPGIDETFATVADAIAAGCLLAGFRDRLEGFAAYAKFLRSVWFWIVPLLVYAAHLIPYSLVQWGAGETIMNLGIAVCIHAFVEFREGFAAKVLNSRPLVFVGGLSYSLYLWQQPFLSPTPLAPFPWNLGLAALAALGSYYLVEKPFLALRQRFERRR